jgi:KaiC/GvpD/RAD55 family RecA-like ATPase
MGHNPARATDKCATGVDGLDQIPQGNSPAGRKTLIIGGRAGKGLLGLEILYRRALAGEAGIFISFEECIDAVRANIPTLRRDVASLDDRAAPAQLVRNPERRGDGPRGARSQWCRS